MNLYKTVFGRKLEQLLGIFIGERYVFDLVILEKFKRYRPNQYQRKCSIFYEEILSMGGREGRYRYKK